VSRQILLIDDEAHIRRATSQMLSLADFEVTALDGAAAALDQFDGARCDGDWPGVVVSDIRMPGIDGLELLRRLQALDADIPVILITGHGDVSTAVQAMRDGAYDFIEKPFNNELLVDVVERALEKRALVLENRALRAELAAQREHTIIGRSPAMVALRDAVRRLASTDADVLINGRTGTGKEVVARALHQSGKRRDRPFVAVNCAAIPESMMESELFGFEAGAFTGASKRRVGKIEHASGGTLFLDEIESMPPSLGAKLLRVLQERCVERLGSNAQIAVDLRVIAATKHDLLALAEKGEFRADLYYRLNVVELHLPSLAARREDISLLFQHFVDKARQRFGLQPPAVSAELLAQLMEHDWPGNVRELKNAADRYVVGSDLNQIDLSQFTGKFGQAPGLSLAERVERFEKSLIEQEMNRQRGNPQATYTALGLARKTFYDKLKKHGLSRDDFA